MTKIWMSGLLCLTISSSISVAGPKEKSTTTEIFVELGESAAYYKIVGTVRGKLTRITAKREASVDLSKENFEFIQEKLNILNHNYSSEECYRNRFRITRVGEGAPIKWQSCWISEDLTAKKMKKLVELIDLLFLTQ